MVQDGPFISCKRTSLNALELATVFNVCIYIYIYCEGYGSYLYNCVEGNYHLDTESLVGYNILYIYDLYSFKKPY